MAQDWLSDVRKYDADADENVVAGIVRHCGIALRTRDASLVSFSDSEETARVREGFCKKKLALTDSDATIDAAIAGVGERMKADHNKNRVTVYYLLAQHFGLLGLFNKPKKAAKKATAKKPATKKATAKKATGTKPAATKGAAATAAAAAGTAPLAAMSKPTPAPAPAPAPTPTPAAANGGGTQDEDDFDMVGFGCLALAVVLGAVAFAAIASGWLFPGADEEEVAAPAPTEAPAPEPAPDSAPATAPAAGAAIPAGSGVIAEQRDERPMLTVYFDTGAADVTPDFNTVSAGVTAYLAANPDASLAISGYNDPTGNAELNAELSKNRAQNVQAALVAAGVDEARTQLVKPDDTTTTELTAEEARRVEVTIVD